MEKVKGIIPSRSIKELYRVPAAEDDSKNYCKLKTAIIISSIFIGCQFLGGYMSKSIAIFCDAFHLLTDLLGFLVSFIFLSFSRKKSTDKIHFGYHRMQLIGALANLFIIWTLALFLLYEATQRIIHKEVVEQPFTMFVFSCGGLLINTIMFFVLNGDQINTNQQSSNPSKPTYIDCNKSITQFQHDQSISMESQSITRTIQLQINNPKLKRHSSSPQSLNKKVINDEINPQVDQQSPTIKHQSIGMKAALYHAISDIIQSIGIMISSIFICLLGSNNGHTVTQWNNWHYLDPISTYVFTFFVIVSTFPVVTSCYYLIMEATPEQMTLQSIRKQCQLLPGVKDVHDLHIWDLRPGKTIMMAHVYAQQGKQREVLVGLTDIARENKIYHSTIQVEQEQHQNHQEYIACDHDIHH